MRYILPLITVFYANSALAHIGHVGDVAGHDHWGAIIAIGLAGAVAIWGAKKGKKKPESEAVQDEAEEEISDAEPQEA